MAAAWALTVVMIPTNTAEPMDPAMVRKEVSREEASASLAAGTVLVPQVSRGIIRLPMARLRTTLHTAAHPEGGVAGEEEHPQVAHQQGQGPGDEEAADPYPVIEPPGKLSISTLSELW